MYQPILMNQIISYAMSEDKNIIDSLLTFLALLFTTLIIAIATSQISYHFGMLGYNLSTTIDLMLYRKALKHPLMTEKEYSTSDIINLSQVDAERMTNMSFQLISLFLTPFEILFGLILLYYYIGISFLVGTGIMIILMLFILFFTRISSAANDKLLKAKDARMKVTE